MPSQLSTSSPMKTSRSLPSSFCRTISYLWTSVCNVVHCNLCRHVCVFLNYFKILDFKIFMIFFLRFYSIDSLFISFIIYPSIGSVPVHVAVVERAGGQVHVGGGGARGVRGGREGLVRQRAAPLQRQPAHQRRRAAAHHQERVRLHACDRALLTLSQPLKRASPS